MMDVLTHFNLAHSGRPKTAFGPMPAAMTALPQRARPSTSPASLYSSRVESGRPPDYPYMYPSDEAHFTPAQVNDRLQVQLELYIDTVIVPQLSSVGVQFCTTVMNFDRELVILVLVNDLTQITLPSSFEGIRILVGEGRVRIHGDFSSEVVGSRIVVPYIGASLGSATSSGAGTLGLYVRDRLTGAISILTALHVFARELTDSFDVVSPTKDDAKEICKELQPRLAYAQESLEYFVAINDNIRAQQAQAAISSLEPRLQIAKGHCHIGKVTRHVCITDELEYLDAVLINVDLARLQGMDAIDLNDPTPIEPFFRRTTTVLRDSILPEVVRADQKVEKVGRTSGFTSGHINTVKMRGAMETPYGTVTSFSAWGVVSKDKDARFSQRGDSGSIIYTGNKVIGLLFGGVDGVVNGRGVDISLFTPIARLQDKLEFDLL